MVMVVVVASGRGRSVDRRKRKKVGGGSSGCGSSGGDQQGGGGEVTMGRGVSSAGTVLSFKLSKLNKNYVQDTFLTRMILRTGRA